MNKSCSTNWRTPGDSTWGCLWFVSANLPCLDQWEIQASTLLAPRLSLVHLGIAVVTIMADCSGRCYPSCFSSCEPSVIADSTAFQSDALGKQCPCQLPLPLEHSILVTTEASVWDNYTPSQSQTPVSPRPFATITSMACEYTGIHKYTLPFNGSTKKRDVPFLRSILLDSASTPAGSRILILQYFGSIHSVTSPGHKWGIRVSSPKAFMYVCMLSMYVWIDWFKFNFQL